MKNKTLTPTAKNLLDQIAAFCVRHSVSPSAVGCLSVGEGSFVGRVRRGSGFTVQRLDDVVAWMDRYEAEHPAQDRADKSTAISRHQETEAHASQ